MTRTAPGDFEGLIADVEQEARNDGPQAIRGLEQLRTEFGLDGEAIDVRCRLGNNLANKLSETERTQEQKPQSTRAL